MNQDIPKTKKANPKSIKVATKNREDEDWTRIFDKKASTESVAYEIGTGSMPSLTTFRYTESN